MHFGVLVIFFACKHFETCIFSCHWLRVDSQWIAERQNQWNRYSYHRWLVEENQGTKLWHPWSRHFSLFLPLSSPSLVSLVFSTLSLYTSWTFCAYQDSGKAPASWWMQWGNQVFPELCVPLWMYDCWSRSLMHRRLPPVKQEHTMCKWVYSTHQALLDSVCNQTTVHQSLIQYGTFLYIIKLQGHSHNESQISRLAVTQQWVRIIAIFLSSADPWPHNHCQKHS